VRQADGENNFHVFYYLLAGADEATRARLELTDVVSYHYLRGGCPGVTRDAAIDMGACMRLRGVLRSS
jgi:myosin III